MFKDIPLLIASHVAEQSRGIQNWLHGCLIAPVKNQLRFYIVNLQLIYKTICININSLPEPKFQIQSATNQIDRQF